MSFELSPLVFGLEFDPNNFETTAEGRKYNYVVTITVADAYTVKVPSTLDEMREMSYVGGLLV